MIRADFIRERAVNFKKPIARPTFSLIHTTARMPDGWREAYRTFLEACDNPADVEYVMAVDKQDESKWPGFGLKKTWGSHVVTVNRGRACPVDGWNRAAEVSTGKFLITVADDLRPCAHWDTEIRKIVPDMSKRVVLDVNNGGRSVPGFLYFSFLTRARYEQKGYVFFPEYWGYVGDDDFTAEALRDGVIVKARHLLFPHLHVSYGLSETDEVYIRQKKTYEIGRQVFARRWGARSFQAWLGQLDAAYIVRAGLEELAGRPLVPANPARSGVGSKQPEADRPSCPKCGSLAVVEFCRQYRCRNCSLNFARFSVSRLAAEPVQLTKGATSMIGR